MEILRRTPWSRIREQNSVYKEFLEIVGNGKPTGNVWKETIAVSATIWISVEKLHHQIRLRILSCSRMSENHREPEVPEAEVPVVECLDGLARITSKELAPIHSVKGGSLQKACSTSRRMDADMEKSALMRIARLMNSLAKGKKNGDKSAVAMLKKHESYTTIGLRIPGDGAPRKSSSILRKSSDIRKPVRRVKFTEAVARHS